jgi:hypothetical protein
MFIGCLRDLGVGEGLTRGLWAVFDGFLLRAAIRPKAKAPLVWMGSGAEAPANPEEQATTKEEVDSHGE